MVKKGLGRGLSVLLGEEDPQSQQKGGISRLGISQIQPNPGQPRKLFDEQSLLELSESIRQHGVITPITVRRLESGYYQIIAGERRWRAARQAGFSEIPAVVMEADDRMSVEIALVENLQREDLNPLEEAEGYKTLIEDFDLTQEEVADRVRKSRPAVTNALRLLKLPEEIRKMVREGALSGGHARTLLALPDAAVMRDTAKKLVSRGCSVREAEALVKKLCEQAQKQKGGPPPGGVTVNYLEELELQLSKKLLRRIRIIKGRQKGKIEMEFYGNDDLESLCEAMMEMSLGTTGVKDPKPQKAPADSRRR